MFNFNFDLSDKSNQNNQQDGPENFREQDSIQSDQSFFGFNDVKGQNQNYHNNNENQGFLDQLTNNTYMERLKKNPYIRHKYLQLKNEMDSGAENQALFIQFNTAPSQDYKLSNYNYSSNNIKKQYNLNFYPKFYRQNYSQTHLKQYPKFQHEQSDNELDERKNRSSSEYSPLQQNWDSIPEHYVINTQEYKGFYSNQYDYQLFKMIQDSEVQTRA